MNIQTINPATEALIHTYPYMEEKEIREKIAAGHNAFLYWKKTSFTQRKKIMLQLAQLMRERKQELATLITTEMGKLITAANAEIDKCIGLCEHFARHAEIYLTPRTIATEGRVSKVYYNPLGIVFAIMPWNFPCWQVFRFAIPNIMAGNAAILKPAPITTGTGIFLANLFKDAGFPEHLFQHVIVDNDLAAKIIEHPDVIGVTLTGSERAGRAVASQAGKFLKKSVLELGGNDPYLVLEDADLDLAANCIMSSRLNNTGQVCISAKRIIVIKSIADALIQKFLDKIASFKMGNPLDPNTNLGPMARSDLRTTLHSQIENSIKQGAKLLSGGIIPNCKGFYYPPTLLTQVKPGMTAFEEELFGPVISVVTADNEQEAISLANNSRYGLGAAVFTRDLEKGERIASQEIEAGLCFVNALVVSDPRVPFGGIKNSGYGRELSQEGILEFVNTKTVAIND